MFITLRETSKNKIVIIPPLFMKSVTLYPPGPIIRAFTWWVGIKNELDVEIARFYNVYGPGEVVDEIYGNVIGIWRSKIINKKPLTIVGDGDQRRDFTHVFDIVDGLIKIALTEHKHHDAWELGTGNNHSVNELYEMFKKKFNVTSEFIPDQPGNYKKTIRKNDDMLSKLNWEPKDRLADHINNL